MNSSDRDKIIEKILSSDRSKLSRNDLDKAASGDLNGVLSKLNREDAEKIKKVLSDPSKTREILSSDAASKLIRNLLGKDKNG